MPVSTDALDEDIKELKGEMKEIRARLDGLSDRFSLLTGEIRTALKVAAWGGTLAVGTLLTVGIGGLATSVWWGSGLTSDVKNIAGRLERIESGRVQTLFHPPDVPSVPVDPPINTPDVPKH